MNDTVSHKDNVSQKDIVSQQDHCSRWCEDAPDPETVLSRALTLVARQVKTMGGQRLGEEDHTARMRLLLAAEFYYDFFNHIMCYVVPPAAVEVAELHRRFAKAVLATPDGGYDATGTEALSALADECFAARGRICGECSLPLVLHANEASGGPGDLESPGGVS